MDQWVDQTFSLRLNSLGNFPVLSVSLRDNCVVISDRGMHGDKNYLTLLPSTKAEAFSLSMIFRKAAKRFGEIGEGLE